MLSTILVVVVLVLSVWAGIADRSWGSAGIGLVAGSMLGVLVFCVGAAITYAVREDGEWVRTGETVYELAEGSSVSSSGWSVSFVAVDEGEVSGVSVSASGVSLGSLEDASEVVVVDWHMESGVAIYPWGEGSDKKTVEVR